MSPVPPVFLEADPSVISGEMVILFEALTGKTLYPAQVERLFLDILAYRECLLRQSIQNAAEQNLVDFADGANLEALGRLLGVTSRLPATPSTATWRITIPEIQAAATNYPIGWTAMSPDGMAWAITSAVSIPAGQLYVDAPAACLTPGAQQNGLPVGTVFTPLAGTAIVTSRTATDGGADTEGDDQLRARILNAPFGLSVAGSSGAYRFHALGAHPSIVDVAVANGGSGVVLVYPLTLTGLPSQAILDAVTAALSSDAIRPMCDTVTVTAPNRVAFAVTANVTLYNTADAIAVMAAVNAAANAYVANRRAGLGRDLISSQVIAALSVPGVYSVALSGWLDRVLGPSEWADGSVAITQAGSVNG